MGWLRGMIGRQSGGYALIEVVTAAAILVIGVLPLLGAFTSAHRYLKDARVRLEAAALASRYAEEAKSEAEKDFASFMTSGVRTAKEGTFLVRREVSLWPEGSTNTTVVDITVAQEGKQPLQLRFLINQKGL